MNTAPDAYRALETGLVWFDRSDRVRLVVTGPDRVRFLHNLTTNDVKRLAPGRGQEAFVTSIQGKTLAFVTLLAAEDAIVVRSDPGSLETFGPHLRKYGVFDDVTVDDSGPETFELHFAGPRSDELLGRLGAELPEAEELGHRMTALGESAVRIVREAPTGRPGLTLIGAVERAAAVKDLIRTAGSELGLVDGDPATFEAARIEAGTPCSGRDVTADNLPQEVDRDTRAINFVKGCYLGQETVARIDALGHVNKQLKGLRFGPGSVPDPGAAIEAAGKSVGTITSASASPGWAGPVALGYVRTAQAVAGTDVQVRCHDSVRTAVVVDLPMLPPRSGGD
jgi:folate-binding protein YgfZ